MIRTAPGCGGEIARSRIGAGRRHPRRLTSWFRCWTSLSPFSLTILDGGQDLIEDLEYPVHLRAGDRERRLYFQHVAEPGVFGGAEDDAQIHRPPVCLQRFGGGRLLGLEITHEFDANQQSWPADIADEPVPRLHLVQGTRRVLAHVRAGLNQGVALEDVESGEAGRQADRELAEGQCL